MSAARAHVNAAMDRFVDGDVAAFAGVYVGLRPSLRRLLARRTPSECEDLVQQSFLRMLEVRAARGGDAYAYAKGDVVGWAITVARRVQIDHHRKQRRMVALEDHGRDRVAASSDMPDAWLAHQRVHATVVRVLRGLPEGQRRAWELCRDHGLSTGEAAATLGVSPNAVKVRVHRVTVALREALSLANPRPDLRSPTPRAARIM